MAGEEQVFDVLLEGGHPHRVYVLAENPFFDFDLAVYDADGALVGEVPRAEFDPFCTIETRWTGVFRLVVRGVSGASRYELLVEN